MTPATALSVIQAYAERGLRGDMRQALLALSGQAPEADEELTAAFRALAEPDLLDIADRAVVLEDVARRSGLRFEWSLGT